MFSIDMLCILSKNYVIIHPFLFFTFPFRYETCNQILIDVQECMEAQKWEEALQHCQLAVTTYQELISDEELMYVVRCYV